MQSKKIHTLGIAALALLAIVALTFGIAGVTAGHPRKNAPTAKATQPVSAIPATVAPAPTTSTPSQGEGSVSSSADPAVNAPIGGAPGNNNGVDLSKVPAIPIPPVMPLPKKVIDVTGPDIALVSLACLPNAQILADLLVNDTAAIDKVSMHWAGIGTNQQPLGKWIGYVTKIKKIGANYQAVIMTQPTLSNALTITATDAYNNTSSRIFTNICN